MNLEPFHHTHVSVEGTHVSADKYLIFHEPITAKIERRSFFISHIKCVN